MNQQQLYRNFFELFKRWPIDLTKKGRDLSEHVRKKFQIAFNQGEITPNVDLKYWSKAYSNIEILLNNDIFDKYPRKKATGALGIGKEHCRVVLSNSASKFLQENKVK
jgi:hypothetical protein